MRTEVESKCKSSDLANTGSDMLDMGDLKNNHKVLSEAMSEIFSQARTEQEKMIQQCEGVMNSIANARRDLHDKVHLNNIHKDQTEVNNELLLQAITERMTMMENTMMQHVTKTFQEFADKLKDVIDKTTINTKCLAELQIDVRDKFNNQSEQIVELKSKIRELEVEADKVRVLEAEVVKVRELDEQLRVETMKRERKSCNIIATGKGVSVDTIQKLTNQILEKHPFPHATIQSPIVFTKKINEKMIMLKMNSYEMRTHFLRKGKQELREMKSPIYLNPDLTRLQQQMAKERRLKSKQEEEPVNMLDQTTVINHPLGSEPAFKRPRRNRDL